MFNLNIANEIESTKSNGFTHEQLTFIHANNGVIDTHNKKAWFKGFAPFIKDIDNIKVNRLLGFYMIETGIDKPVLVDINNFNKVKNEIVYTGTNKNVYDRAMECVIAIANRKRTVQSIIRVIETNGLLSEFTPSINKDDLLNNYLKQQIIALLNSV